MYYLYTLSKSPRNIILLLALLFMACGEADDDFKPITPGTPNTPNTSDTTKTSIPISLNETTLSLSSNETFQLEINEDIPNASIQWTSSASEIAEVNGGLVLPQRSGEAIITAEVDGEQATCKVVVKRDIYLAGCYSYLHGNGGKICQYAKNDQVFELNNSNSIWRIKDIFFDGKDVYIAGAVNRGGKTLAAYWKNGEEVVLESAATSLANSIKVHNGRIVVVGKVYLTPNKPVATYWDNGVRNEIATGISEAVALDIYHDELYIACYLNVANIRIPFYWQDGQVVQLSTGLYDTQISDIVVVEGQVYTCGHSLNSSNGNWIAKYWKNDTHYQLTDGTQSAGAFSIAVQDEEVIVVGTIGSNTDSNAYLWRNGSLSFLSEGYGFYANNVEVHQEDVYITAAPFESNATSLLWKNGQSQDIPEGFRIINAMYIY